ncbi:MAG: hypothetical protein ACI9MC_001053 [Kiritimatiellia bacterium]|jgi:hypothetical protein
MNMRVWTDGQTHIVGTRDGMTVQTDDAHQHEAGASAARWCARVIGTTLPNDCVDVAQCPDGRLVGVRMPSRRAGAHLVLLRPADEGYVWGKVLQMPKAVRTDFRDLWTPGCAPFSRGRKLGQGPRGVTLTTSPHGVCLADHGTGILTGLRTGCDELTQAIRVPTQEDAQIDGVLTQNGFLAQMVVAGRDGVIARFGPTGAHRGSLTSRGSKGTMQILADDKLLHVGLIDGDFRVRLLDPNTLEHIIDLETHGLDHVSPACGASHDGNKFIVCDGRIVVVGEQQPDGSWLTRPVDVHIGEAHNHVDPPALTLRDKTMDLRPGPFIAKLPVINRGGPCAGFVVKVSHHEAVTVQKVTLNDRSAIFLANKKDQAKEARFDNLDLIGDFELIVHGNARLVGEAPLEISLHRPGAEPFAQGNWTLNIRGAHEVCCTAVDHDIDELRLSGNQLSGLVEVMTNLGVIDTKMRTPDLDRWTERVCRRTGVEEPPEQSNPAFGRWYKTWLRLTARDRSMVSQDGRIPLFKFAADHPWHVTPIECDAIVLGLRGVPGDTVANWVTFAKQAGQRKGFVVLAT